MTQLMVSEYLAQNKEEILEYLKNQEENLYYNLESYIHQNLSYLSIYNPNEENYVLNRIYEYEQKRERHIQSSWLQYKHLNLRMQVSAKWQYSLRYRTRDCR